MATITTKVSDALPDWQFDEVKGHQPANWLILRDSVRTARSCVGIITEHGSLIDDPPDTGQEILDLVIHGIGWLHTHLRKDL